MVSTDDILQQFERDSLNRMAGVLDMLHEAGRPDLAGELEKNLRDIRTGVSGARGSWHALSAAQRRVLEVMETGRWLVRAPFSNSRYSALGPPEAIGNLCGTPTIRNLCARELLACDGGVFDPEGRLVLTEQGRFVLTHGRPRA